ncbi:unnamed protein product [Brassica rapa subsp. trilocularis]
MVGNGTFLPITHVGSTTVRSQLFQKVVAKGPNDLYMLESREFSTFFSKRQCSE